MPSGDYGEDGTYGEYGIYGEDHPVVTSEPPVATPPQPVEVVSKEGHEPLDTESKEGDEPVVPSPDKDHNMDTKHKGKKSTKCAAESHLVAMLETVCIVQLLLFLQCDALYALEVSERRLVRALRSRCLFIRPCTPLALQIEMFQHHPRSQTHCSGSVRTAAHLSRGSLF